MRQGPHPLRFSLLILPYGAAFGYVSVALQWIAVHRAGISADDFTTVIAAAFGVHGLKVLWAPVVDVTWSKRGWYLVALALTLGGVLASSLWPMRTETLGSLTLVVMASQVGLTLMGMACENFLGMLPPEEKGAASGWYQAGNFLGLGLGGGLALQLTPVMSRGWMPAAVLCGAVLPCGLALVGMPEPERHHVDLRVAFRSLGKAIAGAVVERRHGRWMLSAAGVVGLLVCLSPIGTGAASNLWSSIADDWHASATHVAAVSGWLGGVVGAVGAALGGVFSSRLPKRTAYALGGALTALTGLLLAFGPRTSWAFDGGALLYQLFSGAAFTALTAFVLETIGPGAVATKYNLFVGLANFAIAYMTRLDGRVLSRFQPRGMLVIDALCTFGGIAVISAIGALLRRLTPPAETAAA